MLDPNSGGGSQCPGVDYTELPVKIRSKVSDLFGRPPPKRSKLKLKPKPVVPAPISPEIELREVYSSDSCDDFQVCRTQSNNNKYDKEQLELDELINNAPSGCATSICNSSSEILDDHPLLIKSQRGSGYVLVFNLYKYKLTGCSWGKVTIIAGTVLIWTCAYRHCPQKCKTRLRSATLEDQKWFNIPSKLVHDHDSNLGRLSVLPPRINVTLQKFRKACDQAVGQTLMHSDGSLSYTVESVYAEFDEDLRKAINLDTEKHRCRQKYHRQNPDEPKSHLGQYSRPSMKKIFRKLNEGDFEKVCYLRKMNPSDDEELPVSALVSWNPIGRD